MAVTRKAKSQNKLRVTRAPALDLHNKEKEYDDSALPLWKLLLSIFIGTLLIFPCIAITHMIGQQISSNDLVWHLKGNTSALFFTLGVIFTLIMLCIRPARELLLPLYVFGHELTHVIFVFFSYGKVSAFNASADGGYIIANRANILVSLSPYIFPFWTLVFLAGYGVSSFFVDLTAALPYFFLMYGASWVFNLFWTLWMIPLGQSDLSSNGTFFSLTLIYLANFYGLSLLIEFTLIDSSVSSWFYSLMNIHSNLFDSFVSLVTM